MKKLLWLPVLLLLLGTACSVLPDSPTSSPLTVTPGETETQVVLPTLPPENENVTTRIRDAVYNRQPENDDTLVYAFFDYYIAHPYELRYLPSFDADTQPDWGQTSFYLSFFTDHTANASGYWQITAADMEAAGKRLIAGFELQRKDSDFFTYADDVYTATGWDWGGTVYWKLNELTENDGLFTAMLTGYELSETEILDRNDPDAVHSPLMNAVLAKANDLNTDSLSVVMREEILSPTPFLEYIPEADRASVDQKLHKATITFTVSNDSEFAFLYHSCERTEPLA